MNEHLAAAVAVVISGMALVVLLQSVTAVNSCTFDVSFPFPGENVCP